VRKIAQSWLPDVTICSPNYAGYSNGTPWWPRSPLAHVRARTHAKVSIDFFLRDHQVRGIRLAQTLAQSHGHSGSVTPFAPRFYSTERERRRKSERERARAPLFESLWEISSMGPPTRCGRRRKVVEPSELSDPNPKDRSRSYRARLRERSPELALARARAPEQSDHLNSFKLNRACTAFYLYKRINRSPWIIRRAKRSSRDARSFTASFAIARGFCSSRILGKSVISHFEF